LGLNYLIKVICNLIKQSQGGGFGDLSWSLGGGGGGGMYGGTSGWGAAIGKKEVIMNIVQQNFFQRHRLSK
jgi:hypothetical protein